MIARRRFLANTFSLLVTSIAAWAAGPALAADTDEAKDYIRVEIRGRLQTGIAAIGGETTGTTISASGATWELDLGDERKLRALAEANNGKTVVVTGKLSVRRGVEVRQRTIVTVESLKPAG
jgi:hypothetical protein